ncbi:MAG: RHS repeat domain-containing protein, partial [Victivallaceae bacterium]
TPINTYTNGPGIDEPLVMSKPEAKNYYYHADALGSITAITDDKNAIVETYQYKAYGIPKIKNATGIVIPKSTIGNTRLFIAREYEYESGLYNNCARYYDPARGAFTQEDGLYSDGPNLYPYSLNNPVMYHDSDGFAATGELIGVGIGGLIDGHGMLL